MKFHVTFSPQHNANAVTPVYAKEGDRLLINGEPFDFGPMPDGGTLSGADVASRHVLGSVRRVADTLYLTLALYYGHIPAGMETSDEYRSVAFPDPITVDVDGELPTPRIGA